jgi:tetratricopeptide (TPR) repeat protein
MHAANTELRLFISSTFQDLQSEREHLIKKVFPEIRAICRQRGITFTEVDLRWGLTEEHRVLGQIIRACLDGIDRCRPYFIGITGDRYGYIPTITEIYKDPELLEQYPWIEDAVLEEVSIIEMEFRYGIFQQGNTTPPSSEGNAARFYFRQQKSDHEDIHEWQRLERLKERVRGWNAPVQEFAIREELGEIIRRDLLEIIDRDFTTAEATTPLDVERRAHEAFAASRRRAYIPNMNSVRLLNDFAESDSVPLVIHGEGGTGKSALLAYWANHYRRRHPDAIVVEHYVGIGAGASDHYALMRHVMAEIRERFERSESVPTMPEEIERQFPNWLGFAKYEDSVEVSGDQTAVAERTNGNGQHGPQFIVLLDGVNQYDGAASHLGWLPEFIPENIRLVVTVTEGISLEQLRLRGWNLFQIEPLTLEEREAIVVRFLSEYNKALSAVRVHRIAADTKCASPLFLRTMLEELRLFGQHEQLEQTIDTYLSIDGVEDLFQKILERLEQSYGEEVVRDVMSLIHVSRLGLSETELADLTPFPRLNVSSLLMALDFHLLRRDGQMTFFHDYLRRAVGARYLGDPDLELSMRERIIACFNEAFITHRTATELCYQLARCSNWEALAGVLSRIHVMMALFTGDTEYEFLGYWNSVSGQVDISRLYEKSLAEYRDNGPAWNDLLDVSLRLGRFFRVIGNWSAGRDRAMAAVELASGLGDNRREIAALGLLGELLMMQGEHHDAMDCYRRQLHLATELHDRGAMAEATGNIGAIHLEQGGYQTAMTHFGQMHRMCEEIGDRHGVARALGQIGRIHMELRQYDDAMACYRSQLTISESLGDRREAGMALGQIGLLHWDQGNYDEAMECYRREMEIAQELGDKRGITMAAGKIGLIHLNRGAYDEAVQYFSRYLELSEELGYARGIGFALGNLATVHFQQHDYEQALSYFDRALNVHRGIDFLVGVALWLKGMAEVQLEIVTASDVIAEDEKGKLSAAHQWADECIEVSLRISKTDTLLAGRIILARIDSLLGAPDTGIEALRALCITASDAAEVATLNYELARLERLRGNLSDARSYAGIAIDDYRSLLQTTPKVLYQQRIDELQSFYSQSLETSP